MSFISPVRLHFIASRSFVSRLLVLAYLLFSAQVGQLLGQEPSGSPKGKPQSSSKVEKAVEDSVDNSPNWGEQPILPNRFITAIAVGRDGTVWAADEEKGLYKIDKSGVVALKECPDPYCYALAEDAHHRLWVGTGRHGVVVWDGKKWHPVANVGLGKHVFGILHAKDGSAWVATEVGLSHIQVDGRVRTFLPSDGLPKGQLCALAEDKEGQIWVAGWLGGAAAVLPSGKVRQVPSGALISDELHDLIVDSAGKVWLAGSGGVTVFEPGRWQALAWLVPENLDPRLTVKSARIARILPDWRATAVREIAPGTVCIGTWTQGLYRYEWPAAKMTKVKEIRQDYIYRLRRDNRGGLLVACYGGGLSRITVDGAVQNQPTSEQTPPKKIPLDDLKPVEKEAAWRRQFRESLKALESTPPPKDKDGDPVGAQAVYLGEDWNTMGNWIGTYGRFAAVLCAMNAPFDLYEFSGAYVGYHPYIGENRKKVVLQPSENFMGAFLKERGKLTGPIAAEESLDTLRYWIHWKETDNPKVLQLPQSRGRGRRQSEWDDHAEAYYDNRRPWPGPHIYVDLRVNEGNDDHSGIYLLSLYFMNKDGQEGLNRLRDYRVTVKPLVGPFGEVKRPGWERLFEKQKPLGAGRVHNFRGGVYQQFLIREGEYTIQINKTTSFNTLLSGIFLDKVSGKGPEKATFTVEGGAAQRESSK